MSRIDDQAKLTPSEEAALKQFYKDSKAKHGDRFLLSTKDERTAKYLHHQQMKERGESAASASAITEHAAREQKYGEMDDELPDLTKPMPKQSSTALWHALEEFVRLSDGDVESFRRRHSTFLPYWLYDTPCGNPQDQSLKTNIMAWQAWRGLLQDSWHSGFHPEYVAKLVSIPTVPLGNVWFEVQPVCNAQRAVLAMALESWRARFCPKCGVPFVARKAADKYWPKACFKDQRREKQRASKRNRARSRRIKSSGRSQR